MVRTPKKKVATTEELLFSQRACQRLVADPEIATAFEEVRDSYLAAWAGTLPTETEKRELAYQHYKAVADVWAAIQRKARSAHVRDLKEEKPNG